MQNMTLDEYTNAYINSIEGQQLLELNSIVLAGIPAHDKVFINIGLKIIQVGTIKNDKAYTITYVSEEEDYRNHLQTAQIMLDSF